MSAQVSWLLEVGIKPGEEDAFKLVMADLVESAQAEPGTLIYESFMGDDGRTVHAYERYADSEAALTHLGNFGEHFAERFLGAADPTGFTVYGNPSAEVREALTAFGPTYLGPNGGIDR
jgi:quinol monooxygenase YgiN